MQGAQIRRNEAYLLVRRLGRLPEADARVGQGAQPGND